MPEIRIDPLTGRRTIVAGSRAARPGSGLDPVAAEPAAGEAGATGAGGAAGDGGEDPFAPGNEAQTPPEVYAVRPDGSAPDTPGWRVRVFPNKYPALEPDAPHRRPAPTRTCSGWGPRGAPMR